MKISEEKLSKLTERERIYLEIMLSLNSLYLRGKPGLAKSAIGLSIASKIDFKYVDRRLSQIDETDIGLYPVLNDAYTKLERMARLKEMGHLTEKEFEILKKPIIENIKMGQIDILHFAVPEWAFNANCEPTIIHLEELNRANIHVRNAALQLLNERQIGDLKLNDNVLIMSSGNLGESDGTEVDEMDLALSNRLVILDHDMKFEEWIDVYAKYHVWNIIVDYIRANPSEYYKPPSEKEVRYATPRSWTNLSKFILSKFGPEPKVDQVASFLLNVEKGFVGKGFVGLSITNFIRYCQDISNININDILTRWDEVKDEVKKFSRSRASEMLSNLKQIDLTKLEKENMINLINFLSTLENDGHNDELTSYLTHILDGTNDKNYATHQIIINRFKERCKKLKDHTSKNLKKPETTIP